MTNPKSCKVKILNKSFEIKCPEGEEANLSLAAKKLGDQMQSIKSKFKTLDDHKILLLSALNISHELIICKKAQELQHFQVTQFISSLESKKNKTVGGENDSIPQKD